MADGSIHIDTKLDNSGFDKDSDKLLSSIKNLTGAVNNIGGNMARAFDAVLPVLQTVAANTANIYSTMTGQGQQAVSTSDAVTAAMGRTAAGAQALQSGMGGASKDASALDKIMDKLQSSMRNGFSNASAVLRFKDMLETAEARAADLQKQLDTLGKSKIPTQDYTFLSQAITNASNKLSDLKDRQDKMRSMGVKENSAQWRSLSYDIEQVRQQLAEYKAELADLEATGSAFVDGVNTDQYAELAKQLQDANEQIAAGKSLIDSETLAQAQLNVQAAQEAVIRAEGTRERAAAMERLKVAQAELNRVAAQSASSAPQTEKISAFQRLGQMLDEVKAKTVAAYQAEGLLGASAEILKSAVSSVTSAVHSLGSGLSNASDKLISFSAKAMQTGTPLGVLGGALGIAVGGLGKLAGAAIKAAASLAKVVASKAIDAIKKVGQTALNAAKNLAAMAGKGICAAFDKLKGKITSIFKANKQASASSKGLVKALTSIKTMLVSRVKRMFITYIMNEIKAAMSALVQFSSSFNASVSGMRNAASELGANLAVSFSNIVTTVAPAINALISKLSEATSYLNAFFAMLGGKSSVTVAKKQTNDYADSLKDATKQAKNLNKANHSLGIDELNVISETPDSSGGGKASTDPKDIYEDVPIDQLLPSDVKSWFDSIKAAFETGNWEGIGAAFTAGLNSVIAQVAPWVENTVAPLAREWAEKAARILNGAVSELNWAGIGMTIGAGINTLSATVNTFLSTFNFEELGAGIAAGVNGLFDKVNWVQLGTTFGLSWSALIQTINGFVTTVNWESIGQGISDFIEGWFFSIDWAALVSAVTNGFNGVVTTIHTVITETDWVGMATQLGTSFSQIVHGIDWAALAQTISDGIINLFDATRAFIAAIDWRQLAQDIITFVVNLDWAGIAESLFGAIGAALGGLAAFFAELITTALDTARTYFQEKIEECGGNIVEGIFKGIVDAIAGIATWISDHIFKPFIDGFKQVFGIHSPSTVMAEMGGYMIDGLKNGLNGLWNKVSGFFSEAVDGIKGFFSVDNLKSIGSNAVSGLMNGLKSVGNKVKEWGGGLLQGLKDKLGIHSPSTETEEVGAYLVTGLTNGLDAYAHRLKEAIASMSSSIIEQFRTLADAVVAAGQGLLSTQETVLSAALDKLAAWSGSVYSAFLALRAKLKDINWSDIGAYLVQGLQSGFDAAWPALQRRVAAQCNDLANTARKTLGVHSPSTVFAEIGKYLDEGLMVGMESSKGKLLQTASNIAGSLTDSMSNARPQLEIAGQTTLTGVDSVASTLGRIAEQFAAIANVLSNMNGLQMPAIAAGTVTPYQTRTAPSNGTDTLEGLKAAISNGNAEMESTLRDLVREIIRAIEDNTPDFRIGDEQILRSYDRANLSRGVRVNSGAFANVY